MDEVQWQLCLAASKIYVAHSWNSGKMTVVSASWAGCSGRPRCGGAAAHCCKTERTMEGIQ